MLITNKTSDPRLSCTTPFPPPARRHSPEKWLSLLGFVVVTITAVIDLLAR